MRPRSEAEILAEWLVFFSVCSVIFVAYLVFGS